MTSKEFRIWRGTGKKKKPIMQKIGRIDYIIAAILLALAIGFSLVGNQLR